jgi:hypothetical protein
VTEYEVKTIYGRYNIRNISRDIIRSVTAYERPDLKVSMPTRKIRDIHLHIKECPLPLVAIAGFT